MAANHPGRHPARPLLILALSHKARVELHRQRTLRLDRAPRARDLGTEPLREGRSELLGGSRACSKRGSRVGAKSQADRLPLLTYDRRSPDHGACNAKLDAHGITTADFDDNRRDSIGRVDPRDRTVDGFTAIDLNARRSSDELRNVGHEADGET